MPTSPFDLASIFAKIQQSGFGDILGALRGGQADPATSPHSAQQATPQAISGSPGPQAAPGWLSGNLDAAGRDPFHPYYAGFLSQPSSEDGMISFGGSRKPPAMITNEDGLLVENPMAKAFKAHREAVDEGQRQAQADETDALIEDLGKAKARKDAAWEQESAARSAYSAQQSEAESQALMAQRTPRKAPRISGTPRMPAERQRRS